jgi:2-iminobutanoate/2-iminopropanoate deaminase
MATKEIIHSEQAPKPIGPYSVAVRVGELVFCSGQTGIDPQTGELVAGGVAAQTRQVLANLSSVLESAGGSFSHVVKTTVFLQDMKDFATMNGVYAEFFSTEPPARSTVQVAGLPKAGLVEIEAIAVIPR